MRALRTILTGAVITMTCTVFAAADAAWTTVDLDGNQSLTIDLPAVIADDPANYKPTGTQAAKGAVFHFRIDALDVSDPTHWENVHGDAACELTRVPYDRQWTLQLATEAAGSTARNKWCDKPGETVTNFSVKRSAALTVDGHPAGECVASYTDTQIFGEPGAVAGAVSIAAHDASYVLRCEVHDVAATNAQYDWDAQWAGVLNHMLQTLYLPGSLL